jgi:hypothetical protein
VIQAPKPKPVSGIQAVPLTTSAYTTQGMIAPVNEFVDPATGILTPVAFRFLYGMFNAMNAVSTLQSQIATLQEQVAALQQGAP